MEKLAIEILESRVGFGELGLDGKLGYDGGGGMYRVLAPAKLADADHVSAHAPSSLRIRVNAEVIVAGFLNASALLADENPVEFWADHNWLGMAWGAGNSTGSITLAAGEHVLEAAIPQATNANRHAVWAIKPLCGEPAVPRVESARWEATVENTAVVTVAEYSIEHVKAKLRMLARSARKQGIWLHALGAGTKHVGNAKAKIAHLRDYLEQVPKKFEYILFVDAADTLFARPLEAACDAFNRANSQILISAEPSCWPVKEENFRESFPPGGSGGRWINSGIWMGRRKAVEKMLSELTELHQQFGEATCPKGLESFWRHRAGRGGDQFLWHCRYLTDATGIAIDRECELAATISTMDERLGEINTFFKLSENHIELRANGALPTVLHFPGWGKQRTIYRWGSYLNLI